MAACSLTALPGCSALAKLPRSVLPALQEVEGQYKEATIKHAITRVLIAVRPEALSTQAIVDKAKEMGIREFEEKDKKAIAQVRANYSLVFFLFIC